MRVSSTKIGRRLGNINALQNEPLQPVTNIFSPSDTPSGTLEKPEAIGVFNHSLFKEIGACEGRSRLLSIRLAGASPKSCADFSTKSSVGNYNQLRSKILPFFTCCRRPGVSGKRQTHLIIPMNTNPTPSVCQMSNDRNQIMRLRIIILRQGASRSFSPLFHST